MTIKGGDVVVLKSGSNYMTVERILPSGEVVCVWFLNGDIKTYSFSSSALKLAE